MKNDESQISGTGVIVPLPEVVRNQIAAGEVIERPASIVKELVENSLDAGASNIQIDLEEGGTMLVRVTDDGVGMVESDLARAFESHATSKLREASDLDHISSLGFRGEALASIGSVARCSIQSRPGALDVGCRIENEGGHLTAPVEAGGPAGTVIEVRDLFYNTPARRRFLKRPSTELSRCLEIVQRMALGHLDVGFVCTHNGKRNYDIERKMDLAGRIRRTFGAELASELVPVEADDGMFHLQGFVAPPRFARRDSARQMWFLNGRTVKDKILVRVLKEAYRGYMDPGRQPVAFLHLSMDPAGVDVNVHPAKAEVRFREDRRVFAFLLNALRPAVAQTDMATPGAGLLSRALAREGEVLHPGQASIADPGGLRAPASAPQPFEIREVAGTPYSGAQPSPIVDLPRGQSVDATAPASLTDRGIDTIPGPFLQVDKTYIVRTLPDGFEVIDQHALHERITYEALLDEMRDGKVEVQRLLVPEIVEVSLSEKLLLAEHAETLRQIGIEIEPFGENDVAVQGMPARVRHPDPMGLVRDVAQILATTGKSPKPEDVIEEVLHSAACRSSIMAGDALTEDAMRTLIRRGQELESDQTCPHSRPTRVRFTLDDLERAFHRK
ncbi:MAG: DNA mismatch repair protein MutL [Candidatus Paceibacteria bacterium]|jgi:DNA mismatch repair protein MutL